MKKFILLFLTLITVLTFVGCKKPNDADKTSFFTVEMGRKVFLSDETDMNLTNKDLFNIPSGYHFSKSVNNDLYVAYEGEIVSDLEEDRDLRKYGVFDRNGKAVIECKYDSLFSTGNFIYGEYYTDEIEYKNDIFFMNGNKILTTDYVVELVAISDDYCALYYDEYSQVFDKDGIYYFKDNNKMSGNIHYSVCDDFLFGYDTVLGDWFIWQTFVSNSGEIPYGFTVLKKIFEGENSLFTVSYLGDYNFLVVETMNVTEKDYEYYEIINGTTYYLKQKTSIYNVLNDTQHFYKSDYPILSVVNHYSPTLTLEQKSRLNIREGYSRVNAGLIDENGERTAYRFFVIDNKGNFVIRYPENMNPSAMRFIDGYGFASGASEGFSASLYFMNCDPVWIKNDREYYGQSYADGRYVLSCSLSDGIRYGVLNSDGETVVDFKYGYISTFVNNIAFFRKPDGTVGIMNINGEEIEIIEDFVSGSNTTSFGLYEFEENGKRGIKTFEGNVIISAEYDSLVYIGKNESKLFIVMSLGDTETFYSFDI